MDVALYRGRGSEIVLVHASMRPPRIAQHRHGPLRYLETVRVDGRVLGASWPSFADQLDRQSDAVFDDGDGLGLLQKSTTGEQSPASPAA